MERECGSGAEGDAVDGVGAASQKESAASPDGFRLPLAFEDLAIGTTVVRGPDWKWGDQDSGSGSGAELCRGVTTSHVDEAGWVSAAWHDASGTLSASRWYRVGASARCAGADTRPRFDIFTEKMSPLSCPKALVEDTKEVMTRCVFFLQPSRFMRIKRATFDSLPLTNMFVHFASFTMISMDSISWKIDEGLGNDIAIVGSDNRKITRTNSSSWGTQVSGAFEGDCEIKLEVTHPSSDYLYIGVLDASKVEKATWQGSSCITGSKKHLVYYKADGSMQTGGRDASSGRSLQGTHTLTITVEMSAKTVTFAVDDDEYPPLAIDGDEWESTRIFACFGSSNQSVTIVDMVGSAGGIRTGSAWWLGDGDAQSTALTTRVHSSLVGAAPAATVSGNRAVEAALEYLEIDAALLGGRAAAGSDARYVHLVSGERLSERMLRERGVAVDQVHLGVLTHTSLMELCSLGVYHRHEAKANGRPIYHNENGRYMMYHYAGASGAEEWRVAQRQLVDEALTAADKGGDDALMGSSGDRKWTPGPLALKVCFYLPLHFKRILLTILTCPLIYYILKR